MIAKASLEQQLVEQMEDKFVSFGIYLLKRREDGHISKENQYNVTDADWRNWLHETYGKVEEQTSV